MTIFILLGIGVVFLFLTSILIGIDNRRRKYKKKMLSLHWRIVGIIFASIAFVNFMLFAKYCFNFNGEECGTRKILLRSTMELSDITLASDNAKIEDTLDKCYEDVIRMIEEKNSEQRIRFVDTLLNKKEVTLNQFHEVKYSKDLTAKQVQVVEYLVTIKKGSFTKPDIYYYIIFGEDLQENAKKNNKNKKNEENIDEKIKQS